MNITMYDVNFGESILYEELGHDGRLDRLLVDCGSKFNYAEVTKAVLCDVMKGVGVNSRTSLLITHFDEDHFNGFCTDDEDLTSGFCSGDGDRTSGFCSGDEGRKNQILFDHIYLPRYLYKENQILEIDDRFVDELKVWTYLLAFGKSRKISKLHKFFLRLPELAKDASISCVGANDSFSFGSGTIEVMWPTVETLSDGQRLSKQASELLRSSKILSEKQRSPKLQSQLLRSSDRLRSLIRQNWDLVNHGDRELDRVMYSQDIEGFFELADEYVMQLIDRYVSFFQRSDQGLDAQEMRIFGETVLRPEGSDDERWEVINRTFDKLLAIADDPPIRLSGLMKKDQQTISSIESAEIRNMNECSVVFSYEDKLLALGDVSPRIIRYLVENGSYEDPNWQFKESYDVVKVQHHGTRAYYSECLPAAQYYLISNSGTKYVNWMIDQRYEDRVANAEDEMVVCTNQNCNRCEYRCLEQRSFREKGGDERECFCEKLGNRSVRRGDITILVK